MGKWIGLFAVVVFVVAAAFVVMTTLAADVDLAETAHGEMIVSPQVEPPDDTTRVSPIAVTTSEPEVVAGVGDARLVERADAALSIVVAGAILDTAGVPIDVEGDVTFVDAAGLSETIRAEGNYAKPGLPSGRVFVRTSGFDGFAPSTDELTLAPEARFVRHDVVLAPTAAFDVVALTTEGKRLHSVLGRWVEIGVIAHRDAPPTPILPDVLVDRSTDGIGDFRPWSSRWSRKVPFGALGRLTLREPLPVHVSLVLGNRILATQVVAEPVDVVEFRVAPYVARSLIGHLVVRVIDGDGAPIEGADVSLRIDRSEEDEEVTDADGMCDFSDCRPGGVALAVSAQDYESQHHRVRVNAGQETTVDVQLGPRVGLEGRVTLDGEPVRAWVTQARLVQGVEGFDTAPSRYRTNGDGVFSMSTLGPHRHLLRATAEGAPVATYLEVDLRNGEIAPVEFALRSAVDVTFAPSAPWPGPADFRVHDARGHVVHRADGWDGRVPLAPGAYHVEIDHSNMTTQSVALDVSAVDGQRVSLP